MGVDTLCQNQCTDGVRRFFVPTESNAPLKANRLGASSPYAVDNTPKKKTCLNEILCGVCGQNAATRDCRQCGGAMCDVCDIDLHTKGLLNHHVVKKFEPGKLQSTYMDSQPLLVQTIDAIKEELKPAVADANGGGDAHGGGGHGGGHDEHHYVERDYLTQSDKMYAGIVSFLAFLVVVIMCIWSTAGLMAEHELVHAIGTTTRPGHIHGTLYSTPVDIVLHGTATEFFEVRLIMMATKDFAAHHGGGHRLLSAPMDVHELKSTSKARRLSSSSHGDTTDSHSGHSTNSHDSRDHSTDIHGDHSSDGHGDHTDSHSDHSMDSHNGHSTNSHNGHSTASHDGHGGHSSHADHSTDSHSDHSMDSHGNHSKDSHVNHSDSQEGAGHAASGHGHGNDHGDTHVSKHGHDEVFDGDGNGDEHGTSKDHRSAEHGGNATHRGNHSGSVEEHGGSGNDHGSAEHDDAHAAGDGHGHGDDLHEHAQPWGKLTYRLLADGKEFFSQTVDMKDPDVEYEEFKTVNVMDLGADGGDVYVLNVTCERYDKKSCAFAAQVVQMGASGAFREIIGIIIFVVCFVGIISERIHRVYSAMLGASAAICAVSAIQETLHLHTVTSMIDFGTLMLLFSMMILMRMLQETGFFNWFAIKVVKICNGSEKKLFFALTYICGIMSMFLDNVTCVMLFGPLTYSLCKKMNLNPRYVYLPMAICATIGGTGTLIGDPPNIVIGSKLQIGFAVFLKYNFPIIAFVSLPAACGFLYWKLKGRLKKGDVPELNFEKLEQENRITDMPKFTKLGGILVAVLLSLLLAPLHHIEPAWFTVMAMFAGAILFQPHKIAHYLEHVEWDTLFFFAMLFCLVEALSELGVIKMLGTTIKSLIMAFPEDQRTLLSIIMLLWVCAFGSAFLESLPFTTTMVYILLDMKQQDTGAFDPAVMAWPLSVGACVGGIGSIMGSSANLVSMAVSARQGETEEEKIAGSDFLKHGLPTMMVVISLCMIWQILLFVVIGMPAE